MGWVREGQVVTAIYLGQRVTGLVEQSRVTYGGHVQHTLALTEPVRLPWRMESRDRVLVMESDIQS